MSDRQALLIACSEYDDPAIGRLRTPTHDITALGRVLADPAIGGFGVTPLIDEPEVTVRRALGRFLRRAKRTDLLVVFFACHGFKEDDGQLYLGARDTELSDIMCTAVPAQLVCRLIDLSPSKRVVVIFDCCFSGAISRSLNSRDADVVHVGDIFRGQAEGKVIISASRATEYAYEPGGEPVALRDNPLHSVFAEALIDGLATGAADLDGDGVVSVTELYEFVHQRVVSRTSAQTPGIWNQVTGKLLLAHRAPARPAGAPPVEAGPSSTGPGRPTRTPFDADLLSWSHGATSGLLEAFADAGPVIGQAWRAAVNGDWPTARRLFASVAQDHGSGDPAVAWGAALCDAVDGDWQASGVGFVRAAELARDGSPEIFAGAALLAASALRAIRNPRWYEPLEDVLERMPACPQALAYRGVHLDDRDALSLAFQLAPALIDDFVAVGVPLDDVVAKALAEAERQVAVLVRARAAARSVSLLLSPAAREPDTADLRRSSPGAGPRVVDRLRDALTAATTERRRLVEQFVVMNNAAEELLAAPASAHAMALVAAVRESSATIVSALRETDRPQPVRAVGVPPRLQ